MITKVLIVDDSHSKKAESIDEQQKSYQEDPGDQFSGENEGIRVMATFYLLLTQCKIIDHSKHKTVFSLSKFKNRQGQSK